MVPSPRVSTKAGQPHLITIKGLWDVPDLRLLRPGWVSTLLRLRTCFAIAAALLLAATASFAQGVRQAQAQTIIECEEGFTSIGTITLADGTIVHQCVMTEITVIRPPDYAALEALYNATGGDNWTNNTNWLTDQPLEDWYGISAYTCREDSPCPDLEGRVQAVNLEENNLSGTIPPELGDLSRPTLIDLSRNKLTGGIPKELSQLTELNTLSLDSNQLTGNIPPEFGVLKTIHFWYLQNNQLSGTLPG